MFNQFKKIILLLLLSHCLVAQELILELKDVYRDQINVAGFTLNSDKAVHIEAVGAGGEKQIKRIHNYHQDKHNLYAYAWIIKANSREMVWRMTIDNSEKVRWSDWNREFDDKVDLERGEYELYFSAVEPDYFSIDGGFLTFSRLLKKIFSDSEDDWEDQSDKWMVRVTGIDDKFEENDVKKYQRVIKESFIVDLTNLGDDVRENYGFTLTKPLDVKIYAIAEGYKGKMYDYAWIIDANTREKVWEMRERDTDYAGGAEKNRVIRETIELDPGDYLVYLMTDDSHSSEEWNANPPYDPWFWGISLQVADKDFDRSIIKKYSEVKQKPIISITRVGDYAYKEEGLDLSKPTKLRIYALGEGRSGDMFDYAWITDACCGKIVWKMHYRKTKHAGGASKNRLFDGIIKLDAGKYIVHYQTDDSHSYEDWNASKPQEPGKWGISIYLMGKEKTAKRISSEKLKGERIITQLTRIGDDEHVRKQFTLDKPTRIRIYCIGEGDWDEMYDYGWIKNVNTDKTVWRMTYRKTEHAGGAKKNRVVDTIQTLPPGTYRVHYRSDDSHSYYDWNTKPPHDRSHWGITIYQMD